MTAEDLRERLSDLGYRGPRRLVPLALLPAAESASAGHPRRRGNADGPVERDRPDLVILDTIRWPGWRLAGERVRHVPELLPARGTATEGPPGWPCNAWAMQART